MKAFDLDNFPKFHLRPDLAHEIGFYDFCRTPMAESVFNERAERKRRAGQTLQITYEEHVRQRAQYPESRFFGVYAKNKPDGTQVNIVTDGVNRFEVPFDGLFYDVTLRAKSAAGIPLDGQSQIVPAVGRSEPDFFVYHDTESRTGFVLPFALLAKVQWSFGRWPSATA